MKSSEILIKYRKKNKMTVSKFANLLGVSQVFLTHLEHDRRKISEELFERLEEFLSKEEIKRLKDAEKYKDIPKEILKKIEKLEKENKKYKEVNNSLKILELNEDFLELPRLLKKYRKSRNLSIKKLSELAGIGNGTIGEIERGKNKKERIKDVKKNKNNKI